MGKTMVVLIIATTLLLGCTNLGLAYNYGNQPNPSDEIHVSGQVLCQDCTQGWNQWTRGARPIKGSVVAITCMDEGNRIVRYARDETDEFGHFDFAVSMKCGGATGNKRIDPKRCRARLVSSPEPNCDVLTNFGGGLDGVTLRRPSSVYRDVIRYTLGPFYFTTEMCQKPQLDDRDGYGNQYQEHY